MSGAWSNVRKEAVLKREIIRVEPLSTYLERWKASTSAVTRHGDTIYVSGFPPFNPETRRGHRSAHRAPDGTGPGADEAMSRDRRFLFEQVLQGNVYCTS